MAAKSCLNRSPPPSVEDDSQRSVMPETEESNEDTEQQHQDANCDLPQVERERACRQTQANHLSGLCGCNPAELPRCRRGLVLGWWEEPRRTAGRCISSHVQLPGTRIRWCVCEI